MNSSISKLDSKNEGGPADRRCSVMRWLKACAVAFMFIAVSALMMSRPSTVHAATINVDGDLVEVSSDDQCSLIEAMINAEDDAATYDDCTAGSGRDVIVLEARTFVIDAPYVGDVGLPRVSSEMVIRGRGGLPILERNSAAGTPKFRILRVVNGGDLTLERIRVTNGNVGSGPAGPGGGISVAEGGRLQLIDSSVNDNYADGDGGGISNKGTLILAGSGVLRNVAGGRGGGIYNEGVVSISDNVSGTPSSINDNQATEEGGGLVNVSLEGRVAEATVLRSTLNRNVSLVDSGGAVYNGFAATLEIVASELSRNDVFVSGGAISNGGTLELAETTLSDNVAKYSGGGIYNDGILSVRNSTIASNEALKGGGVWHDGAQATFSNSTFSQNIARPDPVSSDEGVPDIGAGSAIYAMRGNLILQHTTVTGNRATGPTDMPYGIVVVTSPPFSDVHRINIQGSLVSGNMSDSGMGSTLNRELYIGHGVLIYSAYNLYGYSSRSGYNPGSAPNYPIPDSTSFTPRQPLSRILDPTLRANGGPTQTHALPGPERSALDQSPAINRVPNFLCTSSPIDGIDQRGRVRGSGLGEDARGCDIGAYEQQNLSVYFTPVCDPLIFWPWPNPCREWDVLRVFQPLPDTDWMMEMSLEGEDFGLGEEDAIQDVQPGPEAGEFYLNFADTVDLPNLPDVGGQDIVLFNGNGFERVLDGKSIGLDEPGETIDAFKLLLPAIQVFPTGECDRTLLFSTSGKAVVGPSDAPLSLGGEDVVATCLDTTRQTAELQWAILFDGSEYGLAPDSLTSLSVSEDGYLLYFMSDEPFETDDVQGEAGLLYRYDLTTQTIDGPVLDPTDLGMEPGQIRGLYVEGDWSVPYEMEPFYELQLPVIRR